MIYSKDIQVTDGKRMAWVGCNKIHWLRGAGPRRVDDTSATCKYSQSTGQANRQKPTSLLVYGHLRPLQLSNA